MTDTLEFDRREARQEEAIYRTPAAEERRRFVREHLDVERGDDVLSVGCGPGFEPAELAPVVGPDGSVLGVDRSESMLGLARRRCDDLEQVSLAVGDAVDLPIGDETFDRAVAVQVYEYVDDVGSAVDELARVLRPGGRAVVYDTDFDTLVWRSADPERMNRVLDAFDDHCPRPRLGSELAPYLRDAGLSIQSVAPNTILDTHLDEDTFASRLMEFLRDYGASHDDIGPEESAAWVDDLHEFDAAGESFFSLTQYLYAVRKPG